MRNIKNAYPVLNHETSFKASQLKFLFFSWLFKENDEYKTYKTWKKIYKHINHATEQVVKHHIDDFKKGSFLVDITNTKSDQITAGSYVMKNDQQVWTLSKMPIHTRTIADDFYGMMIYDQHIDQKPYMFKDEDILSKKEQHIKQTTRFFLDIEGKKYQKSKQKHIQCFRVKLKNQDGFDVIGYDLPI